MYDGYVAGCAPQSIIKILLDRSKTKLLRIKPSGSDKNWRFGRQNSQIHKVEIWGKIRRFGGLQRYPAQQNRDNFINFYRWAYRLVYITSK